MAGIEPSRPVSTFFSDRQARHHVVVLEDHRHVAAHLAKAARSPRERSPSTWISPSLGSARWLMQRSKVDLPAPDAPRMTTNSPLPP
jgi:hypothetical protein